MTALSTRVLGGCPAVPGLEDAREATVQAVTASSSGAGALVSRQGTLAAARLSLLPGISTEVRLPILVVA